MMPTLCRCCYSYIGCIYCTYLKMPTQSPLPLQVILQHFYWRKDSVVSQYEAWKAELEEAISKARQGDSAVHLLREHLQSLNKSMDSLKTELDKIKVEDFQTPEPPGGQ